MNRPALPADLRTLRVAVARWSLANGRPLNRDALTAILGASRDDARAARRPERRFRVSDLTVFLHSMVPRFAERTGIDASRSLAESMWTYLAFLADPATEPQLASNSSRIDLLLSEVERLGFLGPEGRPSGAAPDRHGTRRVGGRTRRTRSASAPVASLSSRARLRATTS